jgi:septal ring factor EnvC (AmiA/AmiB activator)
MAKRNSEPSWFLQMVENPTIIVLLVGVAFGYATLSSDVERNAEEIQRLQGEIATELEKMNDSLQEQNARFELYLDSLRNVRSESEDSIELLSAEVDSIEDRLLIIETEE